ncbi:hypothetical protein QQS21_005007 [Conoideocrella luteorostrata]|uniref:Pre-mRNA splicing factor CLF1 n=1 Tax=Conoideocrella luteorostrata TaxID=1105319 RepID=A0AAJ0CQB0_9HYPO|nr:hypothetical protein QQS21_005007 [Conoideocrella luteorostrata]
MPDLGADKLATSLKDSCTVIHDGTLYSYSPEGFLSIRLEEGAKWKTLDPGVKVTGATCIGSEKPKNIDPAFFVVGGQAAPDDYTGLQKFTYSTGKWTTVKPTNLITKHRQWHTSAYMEALDTILVYGGNQDGKDELSSETYSILASEPYTVKIHPHQAPPNNPPPGRRPIITKWTNSDLIMVGGGTTPEHAKIYYFNSDVGWRNSGASLKEPPLKDSTSIKGISVSASDGSSSLITFDLTQSPNTVTRAIVRDATGSPRLESPAISGRSEVDVSAVEKRDLTLANWPKYNSTLAPKETRQGSAIAQSPEGMVVFTGGNADNPIAMFDYTKMGWVNATAFFTGSEQKSLSSTSTTSSTSASSTLFTSTTSTSTAAATTTTAASLPTASEKPEDSGPSSNAILGITLGSIAGFLILLGLILLFLRRRKKTLGHTEAGKPSSPLSDEKDMSDFNRSTFAPASPFRGHRPQASAESYSSVAILMGRMNKEKSGLSRNASNGTARSSISSLHKQFKSTISKPIPQARDHPALHGQDERGVAFAPSVAEPRPRNGPLEAHDGTRRSSGWNRYWSGGSALQILGFGNGKRATATSEQSSRYSEATNNPRVTQDSATVPPLNFDGRPRVNSVNSGSPVVAQHTAKMPFTESMSGTIERPVSPMSSGYSSGIPESIIEIWDPMEANKPWGADRAPSSAYRTADVPGSSSVQPPPTGVSKQPQLAMASTSDMSWLNLGDQSRV